MVPLTPLTHPVLVLRLGYSLLGNYFPSKNLLIAIDLIGELVDPGKAALQYKGTREHERA